MQSDMTAESSTATHINFSDVLMGTATASLMHTFDLSFSDMCRSTVLSHLKNMRFARVAVKMTSGLLS